MRLQGCGYGGLRHGYRVTTNGGRVTPTVTRGFTPQVDTPITFETIELTSQ